MKKVIFICLLSLSVCLSKPSDPQVAPAPAQAPNIPPVDAKTQPPKAAEQAPETTVVHIDTITNQNANDPKPAPQPAAGNTAATVSAASETKPKEAKPDEKDNNTNNEKKDVTPKGKDDKLVPPKDNKIATATETADNKKVNNETKPDGKADDKKEATTQKTDVTTKAAEIPGDIHVQARGFDGPSFIGGIILTLGLLAIGFMGFKYYKNQTERNYHTL